MKLRSIGGACEKIEALSEDDEIKRVNAAIIALESSPLVGDAQQMEVNGRLPQ